MTERVDAGLLGYGSAVTKNGNELCRAVVYGETISEVDALIERGRGSRIIRTIDKVNTTYRNVSGLQPGNAVKEVLGEKSSSVNQISEALLSRGFVYAEPYVVMDGIERWTLLTNHSRSEISAALDEVRDQEDADIKLIYITQSGNFGRASSH